MFNSNGQEHDAASDDEGLIAPMAQLAVGGNANAVPNVAPGGGQDWGQAMADWGENANVNWPQLPGAWVDPDAPPSLTTRLVEYEATRAMRVQLASEVSAKWLELLTTVFADPDGFQDLLLDNPILLAGNSLQGFLLWRNFVNFGPWMINNTLTINLFCPLDTAGLGAGQNLVLDDARGGEGRVLLYQRGILQHCLGVPEDDRRYSRKGDCRELGTLHKGFSEP
ncbi:hypothetical protein SISSUDRAFT_1068065 [Sistotremastrum suecicum HHB10207 ss-3]|uniref:Uncharacterized protein n=1 Tax=Sistotremastrum suecicum HHB10207 ss-3 TaxID=1314776 RepID=A0A165WGJ6_9AGAM|nr:hypothetical protein SISSUDRAFT_1068065 [Sistotremastrum suecicum HHB10207 ss-3]